MGRKTNLKPTFSASEYEAAARSLAHERRLAIVGGWGTPTPTEVERIKAMAAEGANAITIHWELGCRYRQEVIAQIMG